MSSLFAGIAVGATISFLVAAAILKADAKDTVDNFDEKVQEIHQAKQRSKGVALESLTGIQKIIFACDAGMGSSAMGLPFCVRKLKMLVWLNKSLIKQSII